MSDTAPAPLTCTELAQLLAAADPAALLVPPRLLRRVIKHHRKLPGLGLQVPHRKSYVLGRDALLALVEKSELGLEPGRELPATVLLLARPEPEKLAAMPRGAALLKYWRLLFHARIDQHFEELIAGGKLTPADVRERVRRIGQTEFDEVRIVLQQEKYLLPPRDDRGVYAEFAAVYLELGFFVTTLLPRYFPALEDFPRIDRILAQDVDGAALFAATRLAGAPDPDITVDVATMVAEEDDADETAVSVAPAGAAADAVYRALMTQADRAEAQGNLVRAALCRARAARRAPPALTAEALVRARAHLDALARRLQAAALLEDAEADEYRRLLPALLDRASRGTWPAEARLLYDLQNVCVDCERPVFVPDVVEWVARGFRQPLVRPLPNQPLVRAVRHLRSAFQRLRNVRLAEIERYQLAGLLHGTLHHAETRVRERFRPLIRDALRDVGLLPANVPERVAFDRLIEELLDRVVEQGLVTMGDLRDALSRSDLKLPDLAGPGEFILGDRLIRANRRLAIAADGVYRRGEIYLRWLQRFSALAFGTRPGRFLTRYIALPFGGAFVILEGLQHLVEKIIPFFTGPAPAPPPAATPLPWDPETLDPLLQMASDLGVDVLDLWAQFAPPPEVHAVAHTDIRLMNWYTLIGLGIFLLGVLYWPAFRRGVARGLSWLWQGVRGLLYDLPAAALCWPPLRRLLDSGPVRALLHYGVKPLVAAVPVGLVLRRFGLGLDIQAAGAAAAFLVADVVLNSRVGRNLEELCTDWLVRNWGHLRGQILPGLFRLIMDTFKGLVEAIDRGLYAVDEWLRFRGGEGRLSLATKTVLGFVWFWVTYIVRFCLYLLIEPQVNPIKHFPVVTVSHKLVLTLGVPPLAGLFSKAFSMPLPQATTLAFTIGTLIPGIFGFLVWELKENWRLYAANRSPRLRPVVIGHHGETMARFFKPGFHSGTVPRLYARLRKAERRAYRHRSWRAARKQREALQHVEERIQHFFERELLALLRCSKGWGGERIFVASVATGSNRVRVELACPGLGEEPLEVAFEERAGWLLAGVPRPGWLGRLSPPQRHVLAAGLAGFYQLAGVELVREQIAAEFRPAVPPYDLADEGLVVWPDAEAESEAVYNLCNGPVLRPCATRGGLAPGLPVLSAERLLYSRVTIRWVDWVDAWEGEQAGKEMPKELGGGFELLPVQDDDSHL
jgi:hypothetical protein